jgi:hypothetical protein
MTLSHSSSSCISMGHVSTPSVSSRRTWQGTNRMVAVAGKVSQQREVDPVELMRGRADALAQRAANLKKLADAWAPLYQTLNLDQKERMRLLARQRRRLLRIGERGASNEEESQHADYTLQHENLLESLGLYAALETFVSALQARRVRGVHARCNPPTRSPALQCPRSGVRHGDKYSPKTIVDMKND